MSSFNWPTLSAQIPTYSTFSSLPATASDGSVAVTLDTDIIYVFNAGSMTWLPTGGPSVPLAMGTFDGQPGSANGAAIAASQLFMQSATAAFPGLVNTGVQTFAGAKTFTGAISASNLSGTNTGNVTIGTANGLSIAGQALSLGLSSTSTTGALSSADWNTFNNKQSVLTFGNLTDAGTDGITVTNGTGAVIGTGTSFAQHVADATHNGYLSSTDWSTFSSKQAAIPPSKWLYVDISRTDSYTADGSIGKPFKSIMAAVNQVIANGDNTASVPYGIQVNPGIYIEQVNLSNPALVSIAICGVAQESSTIENATAVLINNTNLVAATFQNLTLAGAVTVQAVNTVLPAAAGNILDFINCFFESDVSITNAYNLNCFYTQFNETFTLTNVEFAQIFNSPGFFGDVTLNWDSGTAPVDIDSTAAVITNTQIRAPLTINENSSAFIRSSRFGFGGGQTINLNGTSVGALLVAYMTWFQASAINISNPDSVIFFGSFVDPSVINITGGGTFDNRTKATMIGYTPTTAANWLTVPTTVQQGLDYLASGSVSAVTNAYVVDAVNGSDTTGFGTYLKPYKTLQKAATLIGSAASNAEFNDATKSYYSVKLFGSTTEATVTFGTRPNIVLDMSNGVLNGDLVVQFNQGAIFGANNQQPHFTVQGADLRAGYIGLFGYSGINGNLFYESTGSGSSLIAQLDLINTGVTGDIHQRLGTGGGVFTLTNFLTGTMVAGKIIGDTSPAAGAYTLYVNNSDTSGSRAIGGATGAVQLYQMHNVRFDGAVVVQSAQGGRWFDVQFGAFAHDFTGSSGTTSMDANTFESWQTNVTSQGTVATSLLDTSRGVKYTPTTSANWNSVPASVLAGLDTLATSGIVKSQSQNLFLASPNGSSGLPSFRAIVAADLPSGAGISIGTIDSQSKSANGLVLSGSSLVAQTADASFPGMVSTGTQTLAGAKTLTSQLSMSSNKIVNVTDPSAAQDAATKSYVDAAVAALQPLTSVYAATVGSNIPGTYLNGAAGIGATFTTTSTATFTLDGTTPPLNSRILIKDQTSGFQNGVYLFTALPVGGLTGAVFTRTLDYDTAGDMNAAGLIPVINGTVNALSSWQQVAVITTVGTDSLVFTEFTANPSLYLLKANNLSDVASASASFNNISPMNTLGDIIYGGASGAGTRLGIGSSGQVLTVSGGGIPSWAAPATSGTVTSVSVVTANGLAGTVATATSTPAITLTTTITGLLKGNGTAISAAASGTDYQAPISNFSAPAHQFVNSFTAPNTFGAAQPAFSDLSGNITAAQMLALPSADIYVGNGSNQPAAVALSGDATISNTGALTIANSAVTNAKMANMANNTVKANKSGGSAAPSDLALSDVAETGSAVLTITNGSKTVVSASNLTIQVTQSTTSTSGYLSSTDWNTFNGKQSTITIGALDAQAANANGLALVSNVLSTQSADATHPGMVNNTTQTLSGAKTFSSAMTLSSTVNKLTLTTPATGATLTLADNSSFITSGAFSTTITSTNTTNATLPVGTNTLQSSLRSINTQSGTTYTFVLADGSGPGLNPLVTFGSASATTVTVDTNANVAFPTGTQIDCLQLGAGKVTFVGAGGVTISSQAGNLAIAAQYVGVSLIKTGTNTWVLMGNLIA